jgi:soluble lytic murein transglycosylase-like protein
MPRFLTLVLLSVLIGLPAVASASAWRSTISMPDDPWKIGPLDAFVIADQLGDQLAVDSALSRPGWRAHVREWSRGRVALHRGDLDSAARAFASAAQVWPSDELDLVAQIFDEQRLTVALLQGDAAAASDVVRNPVREHDHAVWVALCARVDFEAGEPDSAVERFAAAWESADALARSHPAFLSAPAAWLAIDDTNRAVEAWQSSIGAMRRPERLREALRVWDGLDALRAAVVTTEDPSATLRFLVGVLRRDDALALVRERIDKGLGEKVSQELFVAEQLYRLRRHEELLAWLDDRESSRWSDEERARAEGYRWGVARRSGSTLEVARGFDGVAETWPDTRRAAEAWWEAAWMYELNEEFDQAIRRYVRHVRSTDGGRFRTSAALRTGLIPWREGDLRRALANFEHFRSALGTGMNQAAAWWLTERAGSGPTELREEHPASPFWRGTDPSLAAGEVPGEVSLYRQQRHALEVVAAALGMSEPLQDLPEGLAAIARIAELGLRTEGTIRLDAWTREQGGDDVARLRATWVAFRWGLPETQARQGWFLQNRLQGRDSRLDEALRAASLPTPFARSILSIAEELDLPPAVLWALMRRESFFDADVVSLAGAHGLMQLMPATAERVALRLGMEAPAPELLYVPSLNVRLGASYLAGLRDEAKGNWIRALAAYNAGENNGKRWEERLREGEPAELGILLISYSETRSYVYNVLRVVHLYEDVWKATN